MKKILCFLMCAVLLFAFAACGDKTPDATGDITTAPTGTPDDTSTGPKINGVSLTKYTVEAANDTAKNASELLSAIFEECGIVADENAENKIIVGESSKTLAENEYVYEAQGKNIYINGNGDDSCEAAVLLFAYDVLGYDAYAKTEVKTENYELSSVTRTYTDDIKDKFSAIEIYVSVNGKDDAEGTKEAPLASLAGAVKAIENIAGKTLHPIVVKFAEGEYIFDETVKFTAKNSGKLYSPIEFSAEDGAKVSFVGGIKISASEAKKVTDAAIIDRIATESAKDKIYAIDLSPYFDSIPKVSNQSIDDYYPVQLFIDGKTQTIARYPNAGSSVSVDAWATDMEGDGFPFYFVYMADEIGAHAEKYWSDKVFENLIASGFFSSNDYDEGLSVFELRKEDNENRKEYEGKYYLRTYTQIYKNITIGQSFYFHNLLEEIDVAGEYYIDVNTKTLYFYSDGNISDNIYVSKLGENMINIASGSSDITFKNIAMGYTRAKAINVQGAQRINIEDCSFDCISSNAISFTSTTDSSIKNVKISECGRGGIILTRCGSVTSSTDANITITGCTVSKVNNVKYTGSACVSMSNTCGVKLSDNSFDGNGIQPIIEDNVKNITK